MAFPLALLPLGCGRTPTHRSLLVLLLSLGWALFSKVQTAHTGLLDASRDLRPPQAPLPGVLARVRRDTEEDCPPGRRPSEVDVDLVFYSEPELEACVDAALLEEQMERVNEVPFTHQQLRVFKRKLDQRYPQGYPESLVKRLKYFFLEMNPEDIRKWNVTSLETVRPLLGVAKGRHMSAQVDALVDRFVMETGQLDRATLDALDSLGFLRPAHLCALSPELLTSVNHSLLWEAGRKDLEACQDPQVEVLYEQARLAFANLSQTDYFSRIQVFLGGASTEDLRDLIQNSVHVDMATFMKLRPEAVMPLTVPEVQKLLGPHVELLKAEQHHSPVREWLAQQQQSDLDQLGLEGGIPNGYLVLDYQFRDALSRGPQLRGPGSVLGAIPVLLLAVLLS